MKKNLVVLVIAVLLLGGVEYVTLKNKPVENVQSQNTGTDSFRLNFKGYDISLYAPDEVISKVSGDYCGGSEGSPVYSGTWQLIAKKNGRTISTLPIGPYQFTSGSREEGLLLVTHIPTKEQFVVINQYQGCNGDVSYFYTLNSQNKLISVPFILEDGTPATFPEIAGADAQFDGTFGYYDSSIGDRLYNSYHYNNYVFTRVDSWSVQMPDDGTQEMATDVGRARRFVFENIVSALPKLSLPASSARLAPDEIDEIQIKTHPYDFHVVFHLEYGKTYSFDVKVDKSSNGFEFILPVTKI